ncbi:STE20 serine/threonine-protein kinase isoform X2 [Biomphalaria glabrata]|nr:STE20 serine/threonine-protein kinase isoform X2 [Biomphalaria glabrata]
MRPYLEFIDIVLQLQHLEDIKELCQNVLVDIDSLQKRGHLWIEDKETSTYTDLKQYIKDKSSEMLQNCLSMIHSKFDQFTEANPLLQEVDHESASTINDPQNDSLKVKMNDRLRTTQLEKIFRKLDEQEKMKDKRDVRTEISLDDFQNVESKYIEFYEELMAELDSNSSFMSQLNTQCHTLSAELKYTTEHKSLQQRKVESITSLAELLFQKQYRFGKKCQVVLHNQDDFSHSIQDFLSQKDSFETSDEEYTRIKLQLVRKGIKTKQSARNLKDIKRIENVNLDSIPELFFCVLTGQSNVKCNEDCPHVIGHHEQQISEGGEDDLYKHLENCIKNPGHTQFIPVDMFSLEHLPEVHRDNDLYTFVKAVADLTVKVSVTLVSPQRPEFWPDTNIPYFLYNMKGSKSLRTGSGIVKAVIKWKRGRCPIDRYQNPFKPEKQWWTLRVLTAANVIFDDSEANHTTLRLFYDKEDSPEVVVNVTISNVSKDINNDISLLDCVTCELNLNVVNRLREMVKHYDDLYEKVAQKYEQSRDIDKLMFIVSHPHGCRKQVSIGQWKDHVQFSDYFDRFTYTTCTCPGSSGASVHCLGYGWYIHCGRLQTGLHYSST